MTAPEIFKTGKRVGLVHVPYQVRGGEDVHVDTLERVYQSLGIQPVRFAGLCEKQTSLRASAASLGRGHPEEWDAIVAREKPSFLHLHNVHPVFGPAFLRWIAARRIPALYTIHNHRFYCTNGLALRNGRVCRDCQEEPSVARPVLRNCNASLARSAYHSLALRQIRSERLLERVTALLAPSSYIADELAKAGVRGNVRLFPHGVELDTSPAVTGARGGDVIFVGRLSEEKGLLALLSAAERLPALAFTIVGEGPLLEEARAVAARLPHVRIMGKISRTQMLAEMRVHSVACVPSLCEESFSLVAAEALSLGLGLVVADSESLRGYSRDFGALAANARDPASLADAIDRAARAGRRTPENTSTLRATFGLPRFAERLAALLNELGL